MFFRSVFRLFALLLAFGISFVAAREEPKRDCYGDPLPEGAVGGVWLSANPRIRWP
ncbi:MAG: hypothetical protein ACYC3I_17965 [Gemmataceae bacterium]